MHFTEYKFRNKLVVVNLIFGVKCILDGDSMFDKQCFGANRC